MNYEDVFWRGTSEVRFCEACSFKMVQLLNSWVCDRCAPPLLGGPSTEAPNILKIKAGSVRYTYSTSAGLDEVGPGYKLYTDFDYITKKVQKKARIGSRSYYVYEVTEEIEDYVDASGTRPASARDIKVHQVWTAKP